MLVKASRLFWTTNFLRETYRTGHSDVVFFVILEESHGLTWKEIDSDESSM
jgi:hypothetical protein